MADPSRNAVYVTFELGPLAGARVLRFDCVEGVSRLFRCNLLLASTDDSIALDGVVGKKGTLTITRGGKPRYIHGMVLRCQQRESQNEYTVYQVVLVPEVWRLAYRKDCRIFQKKSIKEIIARVLKDAGITDYSFRAKGAPQRREYCVQYRESDWDFVCRLLEEEGYCYFFEHKAGQHILNMANDASFFPDITGKSAVPFHVPDSKMAAREHVFRFFFSEVVQSSKITLCDYNFEKPMLEMEVDREGNKHKDLEVYDYPGRYELPEAGKQLAGIRLEQAQAMVKSGEGQGDCTRLSAGHVFSLEKHPRGDFCDKYMVTRVHHFGTKGTMDLEAGMQDQRCAYSNTFHCMPKKVPYRPPRTTRKPHVQGVQTAVVVGPPGEEIHTDEHGRIKVQFHWDREGKNDEKSSCWIRVSQVWAAQGWGAVVIPRIDQEVIVDFIEGDPDRPIVTGTVYHAQNVPPYPLPDDKTRTTIKSNSSIGGGGFNELRFEDKKGQEELFTHAEKDQVEIIKNNRTATIGNDRAVTIEKGDDTLTVQKGQRTVTVKKDITVTSETGSHSLTAKKDISREAQTGGHSIKTLKDITRVSTTGGHSVKTLKDATMTVLTGGRKVQVLAGDYEAVAVAGCVKLASALKICLLAPTGGVDVDPLKGVQFSGSAKGINLTGSGGAGVAITGTPAVALNSPTAITLTCPLVTITAGDAVFTFDASGLKVNGTQVISAKPPKCVV